MKHEKTILLVLVAEIIKLCDCENSPFFAYFERESECEGESRMENKK